MEGRSAVIGAPYWIGVCAVIVSRRQIREANESGAEIWRLRPKEIPVSALPRKTSKLI